MPKKVNKKFLEEMFSKAPQTTLGIKQILILDTKKELERIIIYLKKFMTVEINPEKIKNILNTTSFDHLKDLENKGLFNENVYDSKKNKIRFFNKGPSNDWTKVLDKKIQDDLEKIFYKEMKELGYI